jgi:Kef-type K+ transport system membrane component KefB
MHGPMETLTPTILLLTAGLAAILLARPLKASPIVGFLLGGILLGPDGLGLLERNEFTQLLAELGVAFLLFELGMQFTRATIADNKAVMTTIGPLQMLLTASVFAGIGVLLGLAIPIAILVGGALAISSTAVLARVLADRNQLTCPVGRTAISVSVFQDVMAVFLLIYGASLASPNLGAGAVLAQVGQAVAMAGMGFAVALTIGPLLLKRVFALLAATRNEEAFTWVALLLVLSLGAMATLVGLSMTLGAFLAGLMIASTPYRHIIETEAKPFRGLLLGFFFFSVGMMVDLDALVPLWPAVIGLAALIMVVKTACTWVAARLSGWSLPGALQLGAVMSQGSEFAFVILSLPALSGTLSPQQSSVLIGAIALTLAATPLAAGAGMAAGRSLARRRAAKAAAAGGEAATAPLAAQAATRASVIVIGMGEVGRRVADGLRAAEVRVIAVESDPERFTSAVADGYDVTYGDPGDLRFMETIQAGSANAIVVSAPRFEISSGVSPLVRARYPNLVRYVAAHDEEDAARHASLGMRPVVDSGPLDGITIAKAVMSFTGASPDLIAAWAQSEIARATAATDGMVGPTNTTPAPAI